MVRDRRKIHGEPTVVDSFELEGNLWDSRKCSFEFEPGIDSTTTRGGGYI